MCLNLWCDLKKLLWQDELNPRVRCAFGNVFHNRIEGSLVPYKSEEEVNIGEDYDGMTAIEEEEEKEERHKYNYFSGPVPIYSFTFLQLIVTLARISLSIF